MAKDTRSSFLRALARVEPRIARAFEKVLSDVKATTPRARVEAAIRRSVESGNALQGVLDVLELLRLGPEVFAPLDRAILEAFQAGVDYQQGAIPGGPSARRLLVRFDFRHPEAEAWTREAAGRRITEIGQQVRETVRQTIQEAVEESRPYRTVTRDLLGAPPKASGGKPSGGLIGLHSLQAAAVRRARTELESLDSSYFSRERRDKRFDAKVRKAIREGRSLSSSGVDQITRRYADRLLKLRGETIARTEGNKAMQQGRYQQMEQLIERGEVTEDMVTKIWDATPDGRTRDHHLLLNGETRKWGEPFLSPETGYPMRGPHDDGAPGVDTINCRCTVRLRVDWARMAK